MRTLADPQTVEGIEVMRRKWEKGDITTRDYHDFIEETKQALARSERVYRFF